MFSKIAQLLPLIAATAALALPGAVPAFANDTGVPFKGSFSGTVNWDFDFTHPVEFRGVGNASLLGRTTDSGEAYAIPPQSTTPPGCIPNAHTETLTSANGDQLRLVLDDVACPISPYALHATGHWTVAGGTGRFAGAHGEGSLDGGSDFSTGEFYIVLTGMISF